LKAAQSRSGRFDEEAVVNAISSDLREWEVGSEDRFSSYFYDVFGTSSPVEVTKLEADEDDTTGGATGRPKKHPEMDIEENGSRTASSSKRGKGGREEEESERADDDDGTDGDGGQPKCCEECCCFYCFCPNFSCSCVWSCFVRTLTLGCFFGYCDPKRSELFNVEPSVSTISVGSS